MCFTYVCTAAFFARARHAAVADIATATTGDVILRLHADGDYAAADWSSNAVIISIIQSTAHGRNIANVQCAQSADAESARHLSAATAHGWWVDR